MSGNKKTDNFQYSPREAADTLGNLLQTNHTLTDLNLDVSEAHPSYLFLILFFYQGMYLGNEPAMQLMEQLRTNTTLVNLNLSVQLFIITPLLSTLITKKLTFMNSQGK